MSRQVSYIALQGGEDHTTPLYSKNAGTLSNSKNFECDTGGRLRRIDGYERYDGQTSPSDASYWKMSFDVGDTEVSEGDTVTGATSGATGVALIDGVLESGSYAGSDAAGYLVLTAVSGTFQEDENLQVAAATVCVSAGQAREKGGTSEYHDTWLQDAIETARANIAAVPGSGDILGVHTFDGDVYAFRNTVGGTAAQMYKATTSGWSVVTLGDTLDFDAGTAEFAVDETVTGGTSGATATIKAVIVQSGTWSGLDADGYLVLSGVSGTFQDNETITSASGSATTDGANADITISPGGRYECINYNFGGHESTLKMWGADGVNNAFSFDGTTYVPIRTGMATDTPTHIAAHKFHLFLTFSGGSLQHSSITDPYTWSVVTGAAELGLGEEITDISVMPGDTLCVIGRNQIAILYGTSSSDWELTHLTRDSGGIEYSVQKFSDLIYLDDRGIMSLSTTDTYGDFKSGTLSNVIRDLVDGKKSSFISSIRVKNKDHYRLYFSDNAGINLTFNDNSIAGFTRLEYDHKVCCTCAGEDSSGNEILFFGSDDGMVYQLDKGTSFDGSPVESWYRTWIFSLNNPERKKRFFKYSLEKEDSKAEGYWGVDAWGDFDWGTQRYDKSIFYIDHVESGYEIFYRASETYTKPYVHQGVLIHYSEGGLVR